MSVSTKRARELALNAQHEADGWDREDAEAVCDFMLKMADEVDRLREELRIEREDCQGRIEQTLEYTLITDALENPFARISCMKELCKEVDRLREQEDSAIRREVKAHAKHAVLLAAAKPGHERNLLNGLCYEDCDLCGAIAAVEGR